MAIGVRDAAVAADSSSRMVSLDILRGIALALMILVHFHQKMESKGTIGVEGLIGWIVWMGVEGKAWATFAFLFGAGFAVLMRRLDQRRKPAVAIFLRRMFGLAVIGLVLFALSGFRILLDYAIWGVVLLFVRNWSTCTLIFVAIFAATAGTAIGVARSAVAISRVGPERAEIEANAAQQHSTEKWKRLRAAESTGSYREAVAARLSNLRWQYLNPKALIPSSNLVLFILGLLAIRHGIFDSPRQKKRVILIAMGAGMASWAAAWWVLPRIPTDIAIGGVPVPFRWGLGIVSDQWMALAYIGAITLLLAYVPQAARRLAAFEIAGRMALTNYVIQAALISWLVSGYGLALKVRPYFVVLATVVLFATLAGLSKLWLTRFRYGPLEWVWRLLTYAELQPISKERNREQGW